MHTKMDTQGFEPRAFRMRSGCDTTTPCALASTAPKHVTLHIVCDCYVSTSFCYGCQWSYKHDEAYGFYERCHAECMRRDWRSGFPSCALQLRLSLPALLAGANLVLYLRRPSKIYRYPGSNRRPSACEADVIATRPYLLSRRFLDSACCVI